MTKPEKKTRSVTFEDLERGPLVPPKAVDELLAAVKRRKAADKARPKRRTRPKA